MACSLLLGAAGALVAGCALTDAIDPGQPTWQAEAQSRFMEHVVDAHITREHEQPSWLGGRETLRMDYVVEDGAVLDDPTALVLWSLRTLWSLRRYTPTGDILITLQHENGTCLDVDWTQAVHRLPGDWDSWYDAVPDDPGERVPSIIAFEAADTEQLVPEGHPAAPSPLPRHAFVMPRR